MPSSVAIIFGIAALFLGGAALQPLAPPNPLVTAQERTSERRAALALGITALTLAFISGALV